MIILKLHYLVLFIEVTMISINETNKKLENVCKGKVMLFINNSNIDKP